MFYLNILYHKVALGRNTPPPLPAKISNPKGICFNLIVFDLQLNLS